MGENNHLEGILDVLRLLSVLEPRLDEADPLRAVVGGDVQYTGPTHGRGRGVLEVPNLEDHSHV